MPTRPRLSENQRCIVQTRRETDKHVRRYFGVVTEVLPKGYMVRLDGWKDAQKWSERKVKPERQSSVRRLVAKLDRASEALASRLVSQRPAVVAQARRELTPVPKPEPPEKCEAWLKYVRTLPCCNCGRGPDLVPIEAHHEGKKGVAQKVRDTLAVPLCVSCHRVYTDSNMLPLRTREQSLRILQAEQDRLLTAALEKLEQPARIEVLSKAMARVGGVR